MRLGLFLLLIGVLTGCNPVAINLAMDVPSKTALALPPMKTFDGTRPAPVTPRANRDIARDFMELSFNMESGRRLTTLSRFEGPVTIAFAHVPPPQLAHDLSDLLIRLRQEARIDIREAAVGQPANIIIETVPKAKLTAAVPNAACFVVPRVSNWDEFRKNRRNGTLDWATLHRREKVSVFIPQDVSPQEGRDCLHEEIAQALGPLNDMYRLSDSVFNDDNTHTVLTGFDMLILRIYYSDALASGMTRADVAPLLTPLLARVHPQGRHLPIVALPETPPAWNKAIEGALGGKGATTQRLTSARKAVAIAKSEGWQDGRLAFSHFVQGRLAFGTASQTAIDSFARAYELYITLYGPDDIHTAHVALQLAAFALSAGEADTAIAFVNTSLPAVSRGQNAALLSVLLMIKAEALTLKGRKNEAAIVRLDSLGWARYGFHTEAEIRDRLNEISALRPEPEKLRL